MMLTHLDKKIYIEAHNDFINDPIRNSKDFINFIAQGTDLFIYGESKLVDDNILSNLLEGRGETKIEGKSNKFQDEKVEIEKNNPYQIFFLDIVDKAIQKDYRTKLNLLVGFFDDYEDVFIKFKVLLSFLWVL